MRIVSTGRRQLKQRVQLETLESRLLLSATFSDLDANGTWAVDSSFSHGTVTLDGTGNITGGSILDVGSGNVTPSGTYSIDSVGNVTIDGGTESTGAMNSARDVIVTSNTADNHTLTILVNSGGGNFSNADLTGTWFLGMEGFAGDSNGFGSLVFDGNGHITGGSTTDSGGTHGVSGTYSVSADGTVTINPGGNANQFVGTMNASKDFAALNPADLVAATADTDTVLITLVKGKGSYTNADAAGSWNVSFDGGVGTMTLDGSGHITGGNLQNEGDNPITPSGTYSVSGNGKIVLHITSTGDGSPSTNTYTGQLNAGKSIISMSRVSTTGDKLVMMIKSNNHAPTLTSVTPIGIAVDLNDFTIPYATLLAHSNAGDIDGDGIAFEITAIAPGTVGSLLLNGSAANVGDVVQAGDALTFQGTAIDNGNVNAFSVTAFDGVANSAKAIPVLIKTALQPAVSVAVSHAASETSPATTGKGLFTFSRSGGDMTQSLAVTYVVSGNATMGDDYSLDTLHGPVGTITIPAGASSVTLSVTPVDDLIAEGPQSVEIDLVNADTTFKLATGKGVATMVIADNEPTISVVATKPKASETNNGTTTGIGQFTFTRSMGTTVPALDVLYFIGGTVTNGGGNSDIVTPLTGTVHFDAGSATAVINVVPVDDTIPEVTETLTVTLTQDNVPSYFVNAGKLSATVSIADNEPTINVVASPGTTSEKPGSAPGKFTFTRSMGSNVGPLDVTYSISGAANNGGGNSDIVTPLTGTVHFNAGSATAVISVTAVDDGVTEQTEGLTVTITQDGNSAYWLGTKLTATVLITDFALAPASIAGKTLVMKVAGGTAPFATTPGTTYTLIFSTDGSHYFLQGGTGMVNSTGTYTYNRTSAAHVDVTFADSDGGSITGTLTFTSTTAATFALTQDMGVGTQNGTATLVIPPVAGTAPADIGGMSVGITTTSSTAPFHNDGNTITFSQNSNNYVITGTGSDGFASTGTWSYQKFSANVGIVTQHDNGVGDITTVLTFTTASTGTYVITSASGGMKRGAFTTVPAHGAVPADVTGSIFGLHVLGGNSPDPGSSGNFLLTFDSSTTFFTSDVATPLVHNVDGTYTYEIYSTGVSVVTINGGDPNSSGIFVFVSASATQGGYVLREDNGGDPLFQRGLYAPVI